MGIFRVEGGELKKMEAFVEGWEETMITSCLLGMMGEVYTDQIENPNAVSFLIGDFYFLAGEPKEELIRDIPNRSGMVLMCGNSGGWHELIEQVYGERAKKVTRYAIKKEGDIFDRSKLRQVVNGLQEGYEIRRIDAEIYWMAKKEEWSKDLCGQFLDEADYVKRGLGVVVLHHGKLAAGASSYTVYDKGIEIEIDTKPEYRRKGLAYAAGAGLILECLERGLYPSWDAQNLWSVALAEKLGYHFDHEYTAYEVKL